MHQNLIVRPKRALWGGFELDSLKVVAIGAGSIAEQSAAFLNQPYGGEGGRVVAVTVGHPGAKPRQPIGTTSNLCVEADQGVCPGSQQLGGDPLNESLHVVDVTRSFDIHCSKALDQAQLGPYQREFRISSTVILPRVGHLVALMTISYWTRR